MTDAPPCRVLDWDSAFFARRIARLDASRLTPELAEDALAWSKTHAVECLYFLADSDDPDTVRVAEDHGFRQVDLRVTLQARLDSQGLTPASHTKPAALAPCLTRSFAPADLPALRALARVSHRDSRFYADPNFPTSRCDDLYETWIEKSCQEGYADAVLVGEQGGVAVGYVSCHRGERDTGQIGLFAVDVAHRGRGVGGALVTAALDWFAARSARVVTVVTQGRNVGAQRLYQRGGFATHAVQLWYHKWLA
jgi:dTDP-4-amino-4,6-dideoxy-D-galactose acyltransferase